MALLDFKHWTVASADGKTAHLTHKDGHMLRIAVKALPKIQQQQMQRLAQGGDVLEPEKVKQFEQGFKGTPKPQPKPEPPPQPQPKPMYAEGDTVDSQGLTPAMQSAPSLSQLFNSLAVHPKAAQEPADYSGTPMAVTDLGSVPMNAAPEAAPQDNLAPTSPPAPAQPPMSGSGMLYPDQTVNLPNAVGLGAKAAGQQAGVEAASAQGMQGPLAEQQRKIDNTQQFVVGAYNELHRHVIDTADALQQGMINPRAYQESQTSGQKVLTALGLFLGGAGGHGNMAQDFLNRQIDRDIAAQEKNQDTRKTLLGAYQDLYGKSQVAVDLTRISMRDALANQAAQVAAKLGTPAAEAKKNAFISQLYLTNQQSLDNLAGRLGTMRVGGMGGAPAGSAPKQATPKEPEATPIGGSSSMLYPGAMNYINGRQFVTGPLSQDVPAMKAEMNNVNQAEKGLRTVDNVFPQLSKEANFGEWATTFLPKSAIGQGLGVVEAARAAKGLMTGAGLTAMSPATLGTGAGVLTAGAIAATSPAVWDSVEKTRQYKADQTLLLGALSSALKGTNVGGGQIEDIVEKNTPAWKDTKGTLEKKAKNIKDFIKAHIDTGTLKRNGLTQD